MSRVVAAQRRGARSGPRSPISGRDPRGDHVDPRHDDRERGDRHPAPTTSIRRSAPSSGCRPATCSPFPSSSRSRAGPSRGSGRSGCGSCRSSVFLVGSILSGAAWSASSLIFFRVIQGIGGGMIMPIGTSMMAQAAGPQRIGRVMSILGVPMLLAPILGPVIGGLHRHLGVVALDLLRERADRDRRDRRRGPHAPVGRGSTASRASTLLGLLLLSPGLASVVYGLSQLGSSGSTSSVAIALSIGVVADRSLRSPCRTKITGTRRQARAPNRSSTYTCSATGASCRPRSRRSGSVRPFSERSILLPLYYQVDRGESALVAGLLIAPQGIGAALVMPSAGRLADRLGPGRSRADRSRHSHSRDSRVHDGRSEPRATRSSRLRCSSAASGSASR